MSSDTLVALRDARDRTIATLSEHFAKDTIDMEEFERRLTVAHSASTVAELEKLCADLGPLQTAPAPSPHNALVPPAQVQPEQSVVAIMGSTERRGSWLVPRRTRVFSLMGSCELDFREAQLPAGICEVHVCSLMGSVSVIVPPTLAIETQGMAIMGAFEHLSRVPAALDDKSTVLRITGFALMGAVEVETRLPGESGLDAHRRRSREHRQLRARND